MRLWFSGRLLLLYHTSQYMPLRKGPSVNYKYRTAKIMMQNFLRRDFFLFLLECKSPNILDFMVFWVWRVYHSQSLFQAMLTGCSIEPLHLNILAVNQSTQRLPTLMIEKKRWMLHFTFQKSSMVERLLKVEGSPSDSGVSKKSWDMTLV